MKYSGIGGQAVIEGIMMQNGDDYAIAVRKPDGEIEVKRDRYVSLDGEIPHPGPSFIRGVFKFVDSMVGRDVCFNLVLQLFEMMRCSARKSLRVIDQDWVFGEKAESILMTDCHDFSLLWQSAFSCYFP